MVDFADKYVEKNYFFFKNQTINTQTLNLVRVFFFFNHIDVEERTIIKLISEKIIFVIKIQTLSGRISRLIKMRTLCVTNHPRSFSTLITM